MGADQLREQLNGIREVTGLILTASITQKARKIIDFPSFLPVHPAWAQS